MHEASVHAWKPPSCGVTLMGCWEQRGEFSKAAFEFRAFFFVQRLLPERAMYHLEFETAPQGIRAHR